MYHAPKPAITVKADVVAPQILEYHNYPILQDISFEALVRERQIIVERIISLKEQLANIDAQLKPALVASGVKSVYYGDWIVTCKESAGRKTLDRLLLVQNGVTAEQIQASYKQGKGGSSLTVMSRSDAEKFYGQGENNDEQ